VVEPASKISTVQSRFIAIPDDFVLYFTEALSDTSLRLGFGMKEIPTPFYIESVRTGDRVPFVILEGQDDLQNGEYDHGETIIIAMGREPGEPPMRPGGAWRVSWAIRVVPPDSVLEADVPVIPPRAGTELRFLTSKPFQTGDHIVFNTTEAALDETKAASELENVIVVPNPYVATNSFEPPNVYRAGRGERRIYFMNLPQECTIRIYTTTGHLVQTLQHSSAIDDGQESWNLISRDGMDVAFGVYLYHVEAPGIGEHVGRFALIK